MNIEETLKKNIIAIRSLEIKDDLHSKAEIIKLINSSLEMVDKLYNEIKTFSVNNCTQIDEGKLNNYYKLLTTHNLDFTESLNILNELKQYNNYIPSETRVVKDIQNDMIYL